MGFKNGPVLCVLWPSTIAEILENQKELPGGTRNWQRLTFLYKI